MTGAMLSGVLAMLAVLTVVVWFDLRCLADLNRSATPRLLTREAWALLILITFPVGGILYLMYGKRPWVE
jgi:hypothetical protein